MRPVRFGVPLSELKARIVDAIERAGDVGISGEAIIREYGIPLADRKRVAVHVWQINEQLAATDYRITGRGRGGYRIVRGRP